MALEQLLDKLADGRKLDPLERQQLQEEARSLQEIRDLAKTWVVQGTTIPIFQSPLELIYSKRLEVATASIVISPISNYGRNIIIKGSGRIDAANGGNIWVQVNGDTGASNYAYEFISADGATLTSFEDTSFHALALGVFGRSGSGAGVGGSFRAEIAGYGGEAFHKNCISNIYSEEGNVLYIGGSVWLNDDPIASLEIFGTDNTLVKGTANLAADCEFNVYIEK